MVHKSAVIDIKIILMSRLSGAHVYILGYSRILMKRPVEQKAKGHKAKNNPISPPPSTAADSLSKEKINSLKDKNAAKMKRKK
jgi:hypothetical protein